MPALRSIAKRIVFGVASAKRLITPLEFAHSVRPLRIILGAGTHRRDGWVSTDIEIRHPRMVYLDATRPFPIENGAVDAYFAEHVVEHISYESAGDMLSEIRRTLRPGGVFRVATPDLRRLTTMLCSPSGETAAYAVAANNGWARHHRYQPSCPLVPDDEIGNPVFALNRAFYAWGHRFLYDEKTLGAMLDRHGFAWRRCQIGESDKVMS